MQTNDTAMHKVLKGTCREKEQVTLTKKLMDKPMEIPKMERHEVVRFNITCLTGYTIFYY